MTAPEADQTMIVSRWNAVLAVVAVTLTGGCSESKSSRPEAQVIDSAGLRVVTYDLTEVATPVYRRVGDPDLQIGVVDGAPEYSFSRIVDVALVNDSLVVVSDAVSREIRIFDVQGRYQRSIGQQGEGPGEFVTAPSTVGISVDTLFAYDPGGGRLSSFTVDGQFLATLTVNSSTGNRISELTRRSDGS
jgi:hypothetical protein